MVMIATFYARVSTDSDEQKKSIESQVSYFDTYLDDNKYQRPNSGVFYKRDGTFTKTDGYYVDEGFSGAKSNKYRKAFQQMMRDARLGKFSLIITKSISRFGRNTKEILAAIDELRSYEIAVYFEDLKINTLNRADDFKLTIFAAQAQEESRAKSESVQFGKKQGYKKGIWGGREPYGYNIHEGRLVKNLEEQKIVRRVFVLYLHLSLGLRNIANILNKNKVPTKRGSALWDQSLISKMLKNEIYVGVVRLNRTQKVDINQNIIKKVPLEEQIVNYDDSLRMIEDETFGQVQTEKTKRYDDFGNFQYISMTSENEDGELEEKKVRTIERGKTRHSTKHLFSNLLKCGNCGGSLRRKVQKNKNRTFHYWFCRNNDQYGKMKCSYRNLQYEEYLIDYVKQEIQILKNDNNIHLENLEYLINSQFDVENAPKQIEILESKIAELENDRSINFRLLSKDIIDDTEYEQRNNILKKEMNEAEQKLMELNNIENEINQLKIKQKRFIKFLDDVDVEKLTNSILRKIVNKIVITTPVGEKVVERFKEHRFIPENVNIEWNYMGVGVNQKMKEIAIREFNEGDGLL